MFREETRAFPGSGLRRASVNSFGFCGTNAHAVIDDAYTYLSSRGITSGNHFTSQTKRMLTKGSNGRNAFCTKNTDIVNTVRINGVEKSHTNGISGSGSHPMVFCLSAQDKDGITRVRRVLRDFLSRKDETYDNESQEFFVSLAHTLNTRRTHHQWRTYAVSSTVPELIDSLDDGEKPSPEYLAASRAPRLGFIFTGQGAQWAGMGMELMVYPGFAASIHAADRYLRDKLGIEWSVKEELQKSKTQSKLDIAEFSQSLCSIIQVALVDLLQE